LPSSRRTCCSLREPPFRGADGSHSERPTIAKGVTLARATSPPRARAHRGPWCARSSPRGPTRPPRAARRL
jgi:hypothetical protein